MSGNGYKGSARFSKPQPESAGAKYALELPDQLEHHTSAHDCVSNTASTRVLPERMWPNTGPLHEGPPPTVGTPSSTP